MASLFQLLPEFDPAPVPTPYRATRSTGHTRSAVDSEARRVRPPRKRALLIGINYYGTSSQLSGCINDIKLVQEWLKLTLHVTDFLVLTDVPGTPSAHRPTRANILTAFEWLLAGAEAGDVLYLHYSGHGSYMRNSSGGDIEEYGNDSCLVPVDYVASGMILDDHLRTYLCNSVPVGVTLFAIFDACFSGSMLDLRYSFVDDSRGPTDVARKLAEGRSVPHFDKWTSSVVAKENVSLAETPGSIVMISGCSDIQTSADAIIDMPQGAMTWALLQVLQSVHLHGLPLSELLTRIRALLATNGFTQVPQITSGQLLDLNVPMGRLLATPI